MVLDSALCSSLIVNGVSVGDVVEIADLIVSEISWCLDLRRAVVDGERLAELHLFEKLLHRSVAICRGSEAGGVVVGVPVIILIFCQICLEDVVVLILDTQVFQASFLTRVHISL